MQSINELNYLVEMGTMTKEAADRILFAVVDSMKNVHRTIREISGISEMSKVAAGESGKAELGSQLMTGLLSSLGLTLGGMGVNYIAKEVEKNKERAAHDRSFNEMHRVRPEINDIDPWKTQEFFSILADTAPDLAKNPFIAANFVQRQAAGYGGVGFEEAGALARANESLSRAKGPSMMSQLGDSLTQQGITQIGGNVGYVTRLAIDDAWKTPEQRGREMGIMESEKDRFKRESGMIDREFGDKRREQEMREDFAMDAENRKEKSMLKKEDRDFNRAIQIQEMKDDMARNKMRADLELRAREQDASRAKEQFLYEKAEEQFKKRWGGRGLGNAIDEVGRASLGGGRLSKEQDEMLTQAFDAIKRNPSRYPTVDYPGISI